MSTSANSAELRRCEGTCARDWHDVPHAKARTVWMDASSVISVVREWARPPGAVNA